MITAWQSIALKIGNYQVSEIEVRYDIARTKHGWLPRAILIQDMERQHGNSDIRIEADGSVTESDGFLQSALGPAIISAANHHFDLNRHAILEEAGVFDAVE